MKVLVCTDFSIAAARGENEAVRRFPDATHVLFHVIDRQLCERVLAQSGRDGEEMRSRMIGYADERMTETVARLRRLGARIQPVIAEGAPAMAALAEAQSQRVDLIVMGVIAGKEVGRFRTTLCRRSRVPILVVPTTDGE